MSLPLSSILVTLSLGLGFVSLPLPVQYLPVNAIAQVNSPSTAQDFLDQGVKQLQQGDLEAAINNFNEAIRLNPNYAQAYGNRGIVYSRLQQYEKALADYNQYIRFNPNSAEAYYNRATLYDKLGDYQKAIADYDRAIRLNPNFSQAISNREIAYNNQFPQQQPPNSNPAKVPVPPNSKPAKVPPNKKPARVSRSRVFFPENGQGVYNFDRKSASSILKIIPPSGAENMVIKLEDKISRKRLCWFLILKGHSYETPIPPGQYIIKLATGKKWYGDRHLFGANASYSKIDKVITIPENTHYTITLTPSLFGTLKEKKIGVNQW
ncbi:MAG: tetratricopeptide repeat protein [Microcystis sp. LE19-84.1B]|uniref:tetratricopeptide repeat protein n=1 Tax=Microcystis sp. LE19-84.1B TaxID=3016438 RepID=UPI0022C7680F|nr:tetratricopeptide repeat protein [Microcystis sp. LE19-84.1B]MCZ8225892.1 tetratricopeptide repeat protein [Microcystis sp. LE19-84.1B]